MPKFPFTNYHELNLDWILKKVNALFDASEENARTIRTYDTRLNSAEQTATSAATAATSAQQVADAAAANADNALSVAGTADAKADSALTAATDASSAVSGALIIAQEAQQTAGAAVATANDAAATAASLESLANTANQNATAAVETAGTANQNATAAQTAAQTADQKAVAAQQTANSAQAAASTNAGNISTLQTNVTDLNRQISDLELSSDEVVEVKKDYPVNYNFVGNVSKYIFPDSVFDDYGIDIYTDGKTFITNYDITKNKNAVQRVFYLSPNGSDSNSGLTENKPKKTIRYFDGLLDGDTFILLDGMYDRDTFPQNINKNINIIAQHSGAVIATHSDNNYEWENNNGIWHTSRSNVNSVLFKFDNKTFKSLTRVSSMDYLNSKLFSFYNSGNDLYINISSYVPDNDNTIINLNLGRPIINVDSAAQNINLYVEGITFIGGTAGTVYIANSSTYLQSSFYALNCSFIGGTGNNYNGVTIEGCNTSFVNCVSSFASRDGFNYHAKNGIVGKHIEINCKAYCNGLQSDQNNNNGSTTHDGCNIIRINGLYYCNKGPNIEDTASSVGGKSLNLRCVCFDSLSSADATNNDIRNGTDMVVWIIACKCLGSTYSLYNPSGNTMNISKSIYTNTNGGGTFNNLDNSANRLTTQLIEKYDPELTD